MIMTADNAHTRLLDYLDTPRVEPLFVLGDAAAVLKTFPPNVFDCCMTSPPYWGKREYAEAGIGMETHYRDFVDNLVAVCAEIKRVLRADRFALAQYRGFLLSQEVGWDTLAGSPRADG